MRLGRLSPNLIAKSIPLVTGIDAKGFNICSKTPCKECIIGKSCRQQRKARSNDDIDAATNPLDRVYTDVVGSIRNPSLSGSQYFVTLHDDCSGFSLIRFLRRKSKASEAVQEMVKEIQNLFNTNVSHFMIMNRKNVKWLRSDGGGEYISKVARAWMKENGIVHELTTLYSPESNGKAERLNRTLLDMARCMILNINQRNSVRYWAEAIDTASYLRNRMYTKRCVPGKTSFENLRKRKPSLVYAKGFECAAFVHRSKQKRKM